MRWKPVNNYEGLYEVSETGEVKSLKKLMVNQPNGEGYWRDEIILSKTKTTTGYWKVELYKNKKRKSKKVHRLVAKAFIPNPKNKPQINHIDGNPLNNNVENLEWCTSRENIIHSIETGLRQIKQLNQNEVKKLYIEEEKSLREVADCFDVSVSRIKRELEKMNVETRTISKALMKYNLTKNFIINQLKNKTQKELAEEVGCSPSLISHYLKRIKKGDDIYA